MQPHLFFLIGGLILFIFFIIYGYWFDHKEHITKSDTDDWYVVFKSTGIPDAIIDDISHDDTTWYYRGLSTCVAYGDWEGVCPRHENYCAGNKEIGAPYDQAMAVYTALKKGGQHPLCPLIYPGTT